jgi:hypothetical protein
MQRPATQSAKQPAPILGAIPDPEVTAREEAEAEAEEEQRQHEAATLRGKRYKPSPIAPVAADPPATVEPPPAPPPPKVVTLLEAFAAQTAAYLESAQRFIGAHPDIATSETLKAFRAVGELARSLRSRAKG